MMQTIVLIGAGKSASVLIDYLKTLANEKQWQVFIADANLESLTNKIGTHAWVKPVAIDITNEKARNSLIEKATIVISLLPPTLHYLVALSCIACHKNLLTASYVSKELQQLAPIIEERGLVFLCEMGLDPGIDHMSAMRLIDEIHAKGGEITSFVSHCGGLVAPECDDNNWHYKISWNPKNVVTAGKDGAIFKQDDVIQYIDYEYIFNNYGEKVIENIGTYAYYPNRNSLHYATLYGLENAATFMRTTLRHPSFCKRWQQIVDLQLTDDQLLFATDGISYATFFTSYLHSINKLPFQTVLTQLGLDDENLINKGNCTVAEVLQSLLEKQLALSESDKDLVVMQHEINYKLANMAYAIKSTLVVKGINSTQTAMAKTVGLPLGIAAKLIVEGSFSSKGLHIPVTASIYMLVLKELENYGIAFIENTTSYPLKK